MKQCNTCVNGLTNSHPDRDRCTECLGGLSTRDERALKLRKGEIYKHYVEGDPRDRLLELQRSGEINIVIGGEGEHEVNANWSMEKAYKHLANTSMVCGGLVVKDGLSQLLLMKAYGPSFDANWSREKASQLLLMKSYGPSFVLEWMHDKLYKISVRTHTTWWEAK